MVHKTAVILPALLQLGGISVFLKPSRELCSPAPETARWIFLFNTLLLCYRSDTICGHILTLRGATKYIFELLGCVLLVEFSSVVVWCRLEKLMWRLLQYANYKLSYAGWPSQRLGDDELLALTVITNGFALLFLCFNLDVFGKIENSLRGVHSCLLHLYNSEEQLIATRSRVHSLGALSEEAALPAPALCRCCYGCGKKISALPIESTEHEALK